MYKTITRCSTHYLLQFVGGAFVLLSCFVGCRADIPQEPVGTVGTPFTLPLHAYYNFNNWVLDYYGNYIPSSLFRSSWVVVDTATVWAGYSGVTVVVESTFASGSGSLTASRPRYFRSSAVGDVFEWGFISHLVAERDTVITNAMWDKILSPSVDPNVSWLVESNDSVWVGSVYASFQPSQDLVSTIVNGVSTGVPAFQVSVTGRNLDLRLWISTSPSGVLRFVDDSYVDGVRILRELYEVNTSG
jgi:hypothetical protein